MMGSVQSCPACAGVLDHLRARTGLVFPPSRRKEAEAAIRRIMASFAIRSTHDFVYQVGANAKLFDELVSALTVGETYFFRDPAQFAALRTLILPELRRERPADAPFRIWSAGCATGEEAYSLAILLEEEGVEHSAEILGTDISHAALAVARKAIYGAWSLRSTQPELAARYFALREGRFVLAERFRKRVSFAVLNLASKLYPSNVTGTSGLDLILCRNVLIYFDAASIAAIAKQFFDCLSDGGWLIAGPSDPPLWQHAPFRTVITPGGVLYQKPVDRRLTPAVALQRSGSPLFSLSSAPEPELRQRRRPEPERRNPVVPADPVSEGRKSFAAGDYGTVVRLTAPLRQNPDACSLHIRALANSGGLAAAQAAAQAACSSHALAGEIHYLNATLLIAQGRRDDAIASLRRVIYLDRSLAAAHLTLGALLRDRGARDAARRAFENAYAICAARPGDESVPLTDGETAGRLAEAAMAQLAAMHSSAGGT